MAAIELKSGNSRLAKDYLDIFAGRAHVEADVSVGTLLSYWKASCQEFGSALSYHFPRIPGTISGMADELVRHRYLKGGAGPQAAAVPTGSTPIEGIRVVQERRQQTVRILSVATEWSSGRGGLSTFNRQLCIALARVGADVVCVVLEAAVEEIAAAARHGVRLVVAVRGPGLTEEQRIVGKPAALEGFEPDILIGHGRITGPAAGALQAAHFKTTRRVHFVHMAPDEIEPYKLNRTDQASMRAQDRTEIEVDLARTAARVVAVGPRLHGRLLTYFSGYIGTPRPLQFDPGFDLVDGTMRTPPEGDPWHILLLGRAEDVHLKGLDTAAAAVAKAARGRAVGLPRLELVVRGAQLHEMDNLRTDLVRKFGTDRVGIVIRAFTVDDQKLQADMRSASLVLMPSRAEGFGLVGVEAIVAGTPVLVSAESGLGEFLRKHLSVEQASRVVVEMSGDDRELRDRWAGAIERMLADREASFRRAEEIRKTLAEKKTWRDAAEHLLAELE